MTDNGITEPVQRFLLENISTIEQLEVLLLLRGTAPREWTANQVSRELGSSVMSIQGRLADLAARGLLVARQADPHLVYTYSPGSEEVIHLLDGVAKAYKERRLTVINLIYGKPASDIRSFSEAFKIRKDDR